MTCDWAIGGVTPLGRIDWLLRYPVAAPWAELNRHMARTI